ncbi:MAG: TonB-dependent receptor [Candidatus Acidiferrales bacterium]
MLPGCITTVAPVLLVALLLPANLALPAEPGSVLSGRVLDSTGAVMPGAQVTVFSAGQIPVGSAETDSEGRFELSNLPAGVYELVALAPGMQPQSQAFTVPSPRGKRLEIILNVRNVTTTVTVTPERGEVSNAFDLPVQVNVINRGRLEERPAVILPQALREEVGVQVQQTSGHQGAVIVRGLTGQQVLHLVDGVRFNNSVFRAGPNQYFALLDPSFVERIEVARGPSSAQYGSDSLGGTVNVLPLRPYPAAGGRHFQGELVPFFRSADLVGGAQLRLFYGTQNWSLLGGASGVRVQDLHAGNGEDSHAAVNRFLGLSSRVLGERLQDTGFAQGAGFARFFWNPAPGHNLSASYLRSEQHNGRRYDRLNGGNGDRVNAFDPQVLDFFYARYEKQRLGWLDTLSGTFSVNRQRDDRTEQGGAGNPLAPISDEFNRADAFGYQAQATAHLGASHALVFGGELYDEYIDSRRTRFDPVTGAAQAVRPRYPDESRYTTYGLFYQHGVELFGGRARLQGGLRYSQFRFRTFAEANLADPSGVPLVPDFSTTLRDLTFNLGTVFRLRGPLQLVAAVRRGFRAPNTTDFSSVGLSSNGLEVSPEQVAPGSLVGSRADANAVSTGQPVSALEPEALYNYEVGLKFERRRVVASFSAFSNDISDFISKRALLLPPGAVGETIAGQTIVNQLASGAVITAADPRPVLIRTNVGGVRIWGLEAAWEAELASSWHAIANFYYLRGRDRELGGPPDIEGGLPPASGFLSLRWQPPGKRYWLEGYSYLASYQDRLSSLELADQRIGALRSRDSITRFFNNGAVARGLVSGGILLPTGETLDQVLDRVLGPGVNQAPLFTKTPGFITANLRGGFRLSEQTDVIVMLENLLDHNYRAHGSGVDAPGFNLQVAYRIHF